MDPTLVYDDGCGPCTRFKRGVEFLDVQRKLSFAGLQEAEESGLLDNLPSSRRHGSFHLVQSDGTSCSGARALPLLIALLPGGRLVAAAMDSVPPVYSATAFVYGVFSRLHDSGSCSYSREDRGSRRPESLKMTGVLSQGARSPPRANAGTTPNAFGLTF